MYRILLVSDLFADSYFTHYILSLLSHDTNLFTSPFTGYCLLPVIGLAGLSILVNLKGPLGIIFATITIAWSTFAATR